MGIDHLKNIIDGCFISPDHKFSITGLPIAHQFTCSAASTVEALKSLNAAFLICLGSERYPHYPSARHFLTEGRPKGISAMVLELYRLGTELIRDEIEEKAKNDLHFDAVLAETARWLEQQPKGFGPELIYRRIWEVFFPEGAALEGDKNRHVAELRETRKVTITKPNSEPVEQPVEEILLTANILLTTPLSDSVETLHCVSPELIGDVLKVTEEPQRHWYDHPIPVGIAPKKNEVVYGLRGLDNAVAYEKNKRNVAKGAKLSCALSISVTHDGLQDIAKPIVMEMIRSVEGLKHLDISLWTENETRSLVGEILAPAAKHYLGIDAYKELGLVIGVNGEYGRHYSFLRALAAFWKVCIDPRLKGTFKIDLDQVFPQKQLVEETGRSGFEHFKTPLWGAEGIDSRGQPVYLGMIAGALVNYEDARRSLFTPDVSYPKEKAKADELVFFSRLPQAISTEAEMMARYGENELLPRTCIQRIHVTGGTCGILVEALKKYRPFTPTFVSRAEDQAYLLSVLFDGKEKFLRYVHKDGLIMRHDKEAFAREAIKIAEIGKFVGDLARVLVFSYYADALPWDRNKIKREIDPFTGCFVSRIPITVTYLRLALRAAWLFERGKSQQACELIETAAARLLPLIRQIRTSKIPFRDVFELEKRAWNIYYDTLENIEAGLKKGDSKAVLFARKGRELIQSTKVG